MLCQNWMLKRAPGSRVMVPQSQGKKPVVVKFQNFKPPPFKFHRALETLQQKKRNKSHVDWSNDMHQLPWQLMTSLTTCPGFVTFQASWSRDCAFHYCHSERHLATAIVSFQLLSWSHGLQPSYHRNYWPIMPQRLKATTGCCQARGQTSRKVI